MLLPIARSNPAKPKPIKLIRSQHEQVRPLPESGKPIPAGHLDRYVVLIAVHIEFYGLRRALKVIHNEHRFLAHVAAGSNNPGIRRVQERKRPSTKRAHRITHSYKRFNPTTTRVGKPP